MHWRRKWQPTPVFSPGESQGRRSLVGCHLWGRTELDMTEATWQQQQQVLEVPEGIEPGMFMGEGVTGFDPQEDYFILGDSRVSE